MSTETITHRFRTVSANSIVAHAIIAQSSLSGLYRHIEELCNLKSDDEAAEIRRLYMTAKGAVSGIIKDAERV